MSRAELDSTQSQELIPDIFGDLSLPLAEAAKLLSPDLAEKLWKKRQLPIEKRAGAFQIYQFHRNNTFYPHESGISNLPSEFFYHVTTPAAAEKIINSGTLGIPLGNKEAPNISCNLFGGAHGITRPPDDDVLRVLAKRAGVPAMKILRLLLPDDLILQKKKEVESIERFAPLEVPIIIELIAYLQAKFPKLLEEINKLPTDGQTYQLQGQPFCFPKLCNNSLALRLMVDSVCAGGIKPNFWAYSPNGLSQYLSHSNNLIVTKTGSHNYVTIPGGSDCSVDLFELLTEFHEYLGNSPNCIDPKYVATWQERLELFEQYYFNYNSPNFSAAYWYLWPSSYRLGSAVEFMKLKGKHEEASMLDKIVNDWFYSLLLERQEVRKSNNLPSIAEAREPNAAGDGFLIITKEGVVFKNSEIFNPDTNSFVLINETISTKNLSY